MSQSTRAKMRLAEVAIVCTVNFIPLLDEIVVYSLFRLIDIYAKKNLKFNIWIQPKPTQKNTKLVTQPDPIHRQRFCKQGQAAGQLLATLRSGWLFTRAPWTSSSFICSKHNQS